ncbi:hypothetical protein SteCoe_31637 [Stentor coeruleus]|uniref:RING-type domain-containing protein n=1 Tax=Stentor coeruleus TaxID=5963 RepID=A0A1R2B1A6_9CILI|nr:hypothetical protein SteCoe_31637 [Stentor coeruleus]
MNATTESDERTTSRITGITSLQTDANDQSGAQDPRETPEIFKEELKNWMYKGFAYMLFFLILTLSTVFELPYTISMFPLFILDFKIAISKTIQLKKDSIFKILISKTIIHQLCSITFKMMIIIYIYQVKFRAIYLVVPIAVTSIFDLIQRIPRLHECRYLSWLIILISKWLFLFTIMNVSFKLDEVVEWKWSGVLWPIYIGLCFCTVIIVGVALFTLGSFLSWISDEVATKEFISTLWLLFSLVGATLSILFLCLQVSDSKVMNMGKFYALIPAGYLLVFSFVTMINMKNLIEWWTMFFAQNDVENEELPLPRILPQRPASFSRRISQAVKKAPNMLMRISSSYFQPAESPKQKTQKRTLSLKPVVEDETVAHRRIFSNPSNIKIFELTSPTSSSNNKKLCDMCIENPSDAVIMDCGHGGICYDCSLELWKTVGMCHMCRCEISQVLQIEPSDKDLVKVCSTTKAVYYDTTG